MPPRVTLIALLAITTSRYDRTISSPPASLKSRARIPYRHAFLTPLARLPHSGAMDTPIEELSFEDALKELEAIVSRLESGDAPLDQAISLYERGDRLRRR